MATTAESKTKAEIKEVAPCRKQVEVTVPAESVDAAFDEAYVHLRDNVQIKGFRKGHAPRRVMERRFAKEVAKDVRAKLFQDAFLETLKDNELTPMGEPDIELEELEARLGEPFHFSTEVDVRPQFDLPEYKGLKLTERVEPADDEEIDAQIERLRQAFATHETVDGPSANGDALQANVLMKAGEEELVNAKEQRLPVEDGQLFGVEIKDLAKKLSKLGAGDTETLKVQLPDDYHREALQGEQATIELEILKVERPDLPPADDQLAKRVGLSTLDALKDRLRQNIEADRQQEARQDLERQVIDQMIEKTSFDLPEEFLQRQIEVNLARRQLRLARSGATREFMEEQAEELKEESASEAERDLRWSIISDVIAEKEEVEVHESEVQAHIEALARAYQTTPVKMLKRIQDMDGLPSLAAELRDVKVVRLILDAAEIEGDTQEAKSREESRNNQDSKEE